MQQEIARESPTGKAEVQVSSTPFSALPGQSKLFLDYLADPDSLRTYYPNAVDSPDRIDGYVEKVLSGYTTDRDDLCSALADINSGIGAGDLTNQNIAKLRLPDTVAVVTGQQAGLFTGPLYTIYKALSAVKLSAQLNARNISAVPMFWAATEDHDFDEVSETYFLDASGKLGKKSYRPEGYTSDVSVGTVAIDGRIKDVVNTLFADLPPTLFSDELRETFTLAWSEGEEFGDAFSKTLSRLLSGYGLIIIDPLDIRLKRLAAPLYSAAIQRSNEIAAAIVNRGRELAASGYHEQVAVGEDYFPLFRHDQTGRRLALRKVADDRYRVKGEKQEFALADLVSEASEHPEHFSPGVMLRPVVQDYLLPTVCYFGGGAEIAYFAQNSEAYRVLERPVTPILHRQSLTLVEPRQRKTLDKFNLVLNDLFAGPENVLLGVSADISPDAARLFANVEESINSQLHKLDEFLMVTDPTLAANLANRRRKILYHMAALRKKTLLSEVRRHETLARQIEALFASLLPNGQLQERSINVITYLNKYGPGVIDRIYNSMDLTDKDHRIVDL